MKTFLVLLLILLPIECAYAYIDPGTGSYILQVLIAVFLGAGVFIKVKWREVKAFFTRKKNKES